MEHLLHSESWRVLPWKKFRRTLFRLQHRVWKAIQAKDWVRARNLQKLILRSRCAQFMAVRQVTQLNQGKKTAGIDGKIALEFAERIELVQELKENVLNWHHQKLRIIPIPKKDKTFRKLKVPTIADRAWQCLVKYAIEPAHEALFHFNSYGFRPGRGTWDAQKALFQMLCKNGLTKTVLELDIEKCFDRISHNYLLRSIICPQRVKLGLMRCLKAGTDPQFPNQGAQQGGVISPLLANIALNGIEEIGQGAAKYGGIQRRLGIRYADDMVFILYPWQDPQQVLNEVKEFLKPIGLNVKASKTHIRTTTEGFDFLGWNFRVTSSGKPVITPSKENYRAFRRKVKSIVLSSNLTVKQKVNMLAPKVRGWRNYHRYCKMQGQNFSLQGLWISTYKRFLKLKSVNRSKAKELTSRSFPSVGYKQNGFVKVRKEKTPFDGDIVYWSKRKSNLYGGMTAKFLNKQRYHCGHCELAFVDGERIHLHHIDGNHNNWEAKNLMVVHESCHDYIHMSKSKSRKSEETTIGSRVPENSHARI